MKTDWLRMPLLGGILIICFLLMIRWNEFEERNAERAEEAAALLANQKATPEARSQAPESLGQTVLGDTSPQSPEVNSSDSLFSEPEEEIVKETKKSLKLIPVKTDVLDILIDPYGGDLVGASLPKFYKKLNTPDEPFTVLENTDMRTYVSRSCLSLFKSCTTEGIDNSKLRPLFQTAKTSYTLDDGQDEIVVDLVYSEKNTKITKRFTFKRDNYLIDIDYIIENNRSQTWKTSLVGVIERGSFNPTKGTPFGMAPFLGAATTTDDQNYDKYDFEDIEEKTVKHTKLGGWVAMVQHYFISAWVPPQNAENNFEIKKAPKENLFILSFASEKVTIAPGESKTISAGFYVGPKNIKTLEKISKYLDLTVDYSFLWWLAKPLFFALDFIHGIVGNWGVAIILITIGIKILFFYPSATSYRSMAKMRKLQPKMQSLKEQYGEDRQKFSQEMMKLYKTEKVNPVSGCLPILIQMPVFMALYWVLMESVELRHAPFCLWIQDLSIKDPYFVLPLIMGATMWIQQKLNPTPTDPTQAKVMQMMPIFFTFLFMVFPAGLVLYWVVNNTLSIAQQYIITKKIESEG